MNNFTKDELYDLQSWGDAYTSYDLESDVYKMHEPLLNKIQSMIDNYCDHKESEMDCDGDISMVCKDCGITTMDI